MGKHVDVRIDPAFVTYAAFANAPKRTLFIPLTNGGTGGAIVMFLVTAVGMGLVVVSMAEMASMQVATSLPPQTCC
jgi:amino acid transporter